MQYLYRTNHTNIYTLYITMFMSVHHESLITSYEIFISAEAHPRSVNSYYYVYIVTLQMHVFVIAVFPFK